LDKEEKKKFGEEKKRVRRYQDGIRKKLASEDTVRVQFQSLEGPEQAKLPLEFTYEGVQKYVLLHNGIYDLPKIVINHLRTRCRIPIYKQYDQVESDGDLRPEPINPEQRIAGYAPRFALIPVELEGESVAA
jgi:hypothetical protein